MRMVPAIVRTAPEPTPYFAMAADRGLAQLGVIAQAKVVVRGEVDDLAAVVVAHRRLLVVEHTQLEIGALLLQFFKLRGQMAKLRAFRKCAGHAGNSSVPATIGSHAGQPMIVTRSGTGLASAAQPPVFQRGSENICVSPLHFYRSWHILL